MEHTISIHSSKRPCSFQVFDAEKELLLKKYLKNSISNYQILNTHIFNAISNNHSLLSLILTFS